MKLKKRKDKKISWLDLIKNGLEDTLEHRKMYLQSKEDPMLLLDLLLEIQEKDDNEN